MSIALSLRTCASIAGAVAASVVCGSLMSASASLGSGDRSVYVPITPCRVMDTRPAPNNVGPRSTPLTAQETHTISVLGSNGQCSVPLDASAVAMNVTAVNPTDASFLTVFPADATRPLASSLNWVTGQGATPNAVTSDVSADGKVSFFNNAGNVDVVADIVGYFVDHNHDDRYYTKAETDAKLAADVAATDAKLTGKADKVGGPTTVVLGPSAFVPGSNSTGVTYIIDASVGTLSVTGPNVNSSLCFDAPVALPNGATVTAVHLDGFDNVGTVGTDITLVMYADPFGSTPSTSMANPSSSAFSGVVTAFDNTITSPLIDSTTRSYSLRLCMNNTTLIFYDARIDYTLP